MASRPTVAGPKRQIFPDVDYADNFTAGFNVGVKSNPLANAFTGINQGIDLATKVGNFINEFGPEGIERRRLELENKRATTEINKAKSKAAQLEAQVMTSNEALVQEEMKAKLSANKLTNEQKIRVLRSQSDLQEALSVAGRDPYALEKIATDPRYGPALSTKEGVAALERSVVLSNATDKNQQKIKQRLLDLSQGTSDLDRFKANAAAKKTEKVPQYQQKDNTNARLLYNGYNEFLAANNLKVENGKVVNPSSGTSLGTLDESFNTWMDASGIELTKSESFRAKQLAMQAVRQKNSVGGTGGTSVIPDQTGTGSPVSGSAASTSAIGSVSLTGQPVISRADRAFYAAYTKEKRDRLTAPTAVGAFSPAQFQKLRSAIIPTVREGEDNPLADAITNVVADALSDVKLGVFESGKFMGIQVTPSRIGREIRNIINQLPKDQRPAKKNVEAIIENAVYIAELQVEMMQRKADGLRKSMKEKEAINALDLTPG